MHEATVKGDVETLQKLNKTKGFSVPVKNIFLSKIHGGVSLLHKAVYYGHFQVVEVNIYLCVCMRLSFRLFNYNTTEVYIVKKTIVIIILIHFVDVVFGLALSSNRQREG